VFPLPPRTSGMSRIAARSAAESPPPGNGGSGSLHGSVYHSFFPSMFAEPGMAAKQASEHGDHRDELEFVFHPQVQAFFDQFCALQDVHIADQKTRRPHRVLRSRRTLAASDRTNDPAVTRRNLAIGWSGMSSSTYCRISTGA